MKSWWKLGVLLAVAGAGLAAWYYGFRESDETYEFFTSAVTRQTIQNTISATGAVEAMVMVEVGSQVTGQVIELNADFNSIVQAGQVLARLDPKSVETQLRNVRANLTSAQSRIQTAEADLENAITSVGTAEANLRTAETDLELSRRNYQRSLSLYEDNLVAETEVENVTTQVQSAEVRLLQQQASLQQARSSILSREAAITQAYASLEQAEADLEEAELNVDYTVIRSPVDGVVISREVDLGQTVSASTSAPTLFLIANDLTRMQVQASIDEADIGLVSANNEVTFRVDAYPNDEFLGQISEIRLNPSNSQNVVTYSVIITFSNPGMKLKPGMTANITILVDRREDVLTVPNTALRYSPPAAALAQAVEAAANPEAGDEGEAVAEEAFARGGNGRGFPEGAEGFAGRGRGGNRGGGGRGGGNAPAAFANAAPAGADEAPVVVAGDKITFAAIPAEPPRPGQVWVMTENGVPEERQLMVGLTDGSRTEVVSGDLEAGELVLIGDSSLAAAQSGGTGNVGDDPRRLMQMLGGGGGGGRGGGGRGR